MAKGFYQEPPKFVRTSDGGLAPVEAANKLKADPAKEEPTTEPAKKTADDLFWPKEFPR